MLGKSAFYLVRMREPNLPIDPEASGEVLIAPNLPRYGVS